MKQLKNIYILFLLVVTTQVTFSQLPFKPIPSSSTGDLLIPEGLKYDVIFREGDTVVNKKGKKASAKGGHDYNAFIPSKSGNEGLMYTSHEVNEPNDLIGDGGGGTVYKIKRTEGKWVASEKYAIDFSNVGETYNNCSGTLTPKGTLFTTEEGAPSSNKLLYSSFGRPSFRDTSNFNGLKRYQNMGWAVEVDLKEKAATSKLYKMGRFAHEGAWAMPDRKTVYLADDYFPSVFFKFVADKEDDYREGQLYAFKQTTEGKAGSWISLPMVMDSLINIRDVALRMGATAFVRMEWITYANGKIYITETGTDNFTMDKSKIFNSELAYYIKNNFSTGNNSYDYPYGAVIEFNPDNNILKPLIFGGKGKNDASKHFSNPDGLTHSLINGKEYLVINEDIIGDTKERVSKEAKAEGKWINEIWWLNLSIKNPTVDDLQRFLVAPQGSETTGGYFTPNGGTYFVNIQHPSTKNKFPFDKSCTIAISGFGKIKNKEVRKADKKISK